MKRAWALCAMLVLGCQGDPTEPIGPSVVGGNSNWLIACGSAVDCSAPQIPECACGVCTVGCSSDDDCAEIEGARCALEEHPASRSVCASAMSEGICLPGCEPGECNAAQACVDGACVPAVLPENAFCAEASASDADRAFEDELLALVNQRRSAGDLVCAGAAASTPQLELRFDPRLRCAARRLAIDIAETRMQGVLDSEGRGTGDRLPLASYEASQWYEGFALEADSAEAALALMLNDAGVCTALASASFRDIGTAASADAFVLLVATP
jgi:hypothetical protein